MKLLFLLSITTLLVSRSLNSNYEHTFTSDETSFYLTFVDEINVQKDLVKKYLNDGDYDNAQDHLTRMNELYTDEIKNELAEKNQRISKEISSSIRGVGDQIKQRLDAKSILNSIDVLDPILAESLDVRLDPESLNNSTIHALHFASLVNSMDINYRTSILSKNSLNDSEIGVSIVSNKTEQMNHDHMEAQTTNMERIASNITDIVSYDTAKGLLTVIKNLYNSTVKHDTNQTQSTDLDKINIALDQSEDIINSVRPYKELAVQIHGIIHPTIIDIYGLDHLDINQPTTLNLQQQDSHS